jgi:hypothetical protein
MSMTHIPHPILMIALFLCPALSSAQDFSISDKAFTIKRIDKAPEIDGIIGDSEWAGVGRLSDLHQVKPVEFAAPSERTTWFIAYDDMALYIAAHALDSEPDEIVAQTLRQGSNLSSDDSMSVLIDAFNNKRSGYKFTLNPNGVRAEAIYATATRPSDDWDGIWRGAAVIVDDGWTMEMAIPFNTITFDPANETWGINFHRKIARKNEDIGWQSRSGEINPTVSGEVQGLAGLSQGLGLDVIPSASSVYNDDRVLGSSDAEFNPSLDINYKLTPSVTGLLTLNTDFAATEVDGRQLDLQRFSLFFPEKRSFFLTDFDIFQFGGVPTGGQFWQQPTGMRSGSNGLAFFSRRIGLTNNRVPVDIDAGAKISGRVGDLDFGTLYIRQDEYAGVDATDLIVARASTGVLEESSVGAILTSGDPGSNSDSTLVGADFLYRNTRLGNNRSMHGNFWIQKSDNDGVDGDDLAWSANIGFPSQVGFEGGFQVQEVEANFDPALGFASRTGVRLYGGEFGHRRIREGDVLIRQVAHSVSVTHWEYLNTGSIQSQEIEVELLGLQSSAGDFSRLHYTFQTEGLLIGEQPLESIGITIPPGEHKFEEYGLFLSSARHRKWSVEMNLDGGEIYNGDLYRIGPGVDWRPNDRINFSLKYEYTKYDFPGQSAITRQVTFENEISFNAKLSLVSLAQFDNISDDIGINSRLRYNLSAGQDVWFVINHNMTRDPLDDRFHSTQSVAAAKIRYTFRY